MGEHRLMLMVMVWVWVTKPLKNPFLISHGHGSWPRAMTMKMI
jgi:hypothetical protein